MKKLIVALNIAGIIAWCLAVEVALEANVVSQNVSPILFCLAWVWGGLLWRKTRTSPARDAR